MSSPDTKTAPNIAPTEDNPAPPPAIDGPATTGAQSTGENGTAAAADDKPENSRPNVADIEYPTGIKLALLMTSIFVGMFLVSLVCPRLGSLLVLEST
jgi:hypothetical protein